jgi:hypothetical protein
VLRQASSRVSGVQPIVDPICALKSDPMAAQSLHRSMTYSYETDLEATALIVLSVSMHWDSEDEPEAVANGRPVGAGHSVWRAVFRRVSAYASSDYLQYK